MADANIDAKYELVEQSKTEPIHEVVAKLLQLYYPALPAVAIVTTPFSGAHFSRRVNRKATIDAGDPTFWRIVRHLKARCAATDRACIAGWRYGLIYDTATEGPPEWVLDYHTEPPRRYVASRDTDASWCLKVIRNSASSTSWRVVLTITGDRDLPLATLDTSAFGTYQVIVDNSSDMFGYAAVRLHRQWFSHLESPASYLVFGSAYLQVRLLGDSQLSRLIPALHLAPRAMTSLRMDASLRRPLDKTIAKHCWTPVHSERTTAKDLSRELKHIQ